VSGGATVELQVLGRGGVPTTGVGAVTLNLTIVQPVSSGSVTVWPEGDRPTASNVTMDHANQVIAAHVTVAVGADGKVRLRPSVAASLVVDVQGYYTGTGAPAGRRGLFVPISPTRLFDTRGFGQPVPGRAIVQAGVSGGLFAPGTAAAVVFNLTAAASGGPGHVTASPWPPPIPVASNLSLERRGQAIANLVSVRVGPPDRIALYTSVTTHLILDVAGYYTA
jgi:hypothetical protein